MAVNKLDISMMEDVGTSANQLVQRDGSGNLPAIDGSQLTGVDPGFTVSTSDPVIATNPSGGVGTKWINKTSGEVYVCTDATAGANVWTNVGAGSGDIEPAVYQGVSYGYLAGGYPVPVGGNKIDKFSFTTDGNATDVGDLATAVYGPCGHSSTTDGYISGGSIGPPAWTNISDITKFSFASGGNAVDTTKDLLSIDNGIGSTHSATYAYILGGYAAPVRSIYQKFAFVSTANSTNIGNLFTTSGNFQNAGWADWGNSCLL